MSNTVIVHLKGWDGQYCRLNITQLIIIDHNQTL